MSRIEQRGSRPVRRWSVWAYVSASQLPSTSTIVRVLLLAPYGAFGPWFCSYFPPVSPALGWGSKSNSQKGQMMICAESHPWPGPQCVISLGCHVCLCYSMSHVPIICVDVCHSCLRVHIPVCCVVYVVLFMSRMSQFYSRAVSCLCYVRPELLWVALFVCPRGVCVRLLVFLNIRVDVCVLALSLPGACVRACVRACVISLGCYVCLVLFYVTRPYYMCGCLSLMSPSTNACVLGCLCRVVYVTYVPML